MYHTCTSTDALNSEGHFWLLFWPTLFGFWSTNFLWDFILESALSHPVSILLLKKITDSPNLLSTYETCTTHFFKEKNLYFQLLYFYFWFEQKERSFNFYNTYSQSIFLFNSLFIELDSIPLCLFKISKFKCKFYLWILIWL